jgi:tRNA modification GTPase
VLRVTATIFAPATGIGRAAIAVVRLSGAAAATIVAALADGLPAPRRASLRTLRGAGGDMLDRALVLWLPGPNSYTGEDCAELHLHGGRAVVEAVCAALMARGAEPAEPGEFTRRAFLNGRMDLLEAEAVADLIDADTETQRRQALAQLGGAQSALLAAWAARLRRLLAWQEALIDFPDEDLPAEVEATLLSELAGLSADLEAAAADAQRGARVRDGVVIAVSGPPNVGKSSLVNVLAGRDVAITSPVPGTTRDALEVRIDVAGVPVTLIDTAGLRETADPVEAEGVRRARDRAAHADLVMHVAEAGGAKPAGLDGLLIANKLDLAPDRAPERGGWLAVSAATGAGIASLRQAMEAAVRRLTASGPNPVLSRARHEAALRESAAFLGRAKAADLPELRGEELRLAMRALGRITGAVGVEDVLDTVFGAFCIGK